MKQIVRKTRAVGVGGRKKNLPSVVSLGVSTCLHPLYSRCRRLRKPEEVNTRHCHCRDRSVGVHTQFSGLTGNVLRCFLLGQASGEQATGHCTTHVPTFLPWRTFEMPLLHLISPYRTFIFIL